MRAKLPVSLSGLGSAFDPRLAFVVAADGKPSPIVLNYGDIACQQIAVTNVPSNASAERAGKWYEGTRSPAAQLCRKRK